MSISSNNDTLSQNMLTYQSLSFSDIYWLIRIQNPLGLPFGIILKFIEKSVVDILKDKV